MSNLVKDLMIASEAEVQTRAVELCSVRMTLSQDDWIRCLADCRDNIFDTSIRPLHTITPQARLGFVQQAHAVIELGDNTTQSENRRNLQSTR